MAYGRWPKAGKAEPSNSQITRRSSERRFNLTAGLAGHHCHRHSVRVGDGEERLALGAVSNLPHYTQVPSCAPLPCANLRMLQKPSFSPARPSATRRTFHRAAFSLRSKPQRTKQSTPRPFARCGLAGQAFSAFSVTRFVRPRTPAERFACPARWGFCNHLNLPHPPRPTPSSHAHPESA
jgi:hypothetical protein